MSRARDYGLAFAMGVFIAVMLGNLAYRVATWDTEWFGLRKPPCR